jgi:hypothetical protein
MFDEVCSQAAPTQSPGVARPLQLIRRSRLERGEPSSWELMMSVGREIDGGAEDRASGAVFRFAAAAQTTRTSAILLTA